MLATIKSQPPVQTALDLAISTEPRSKTQLLSLLTGCWNLRQPINMDYIGTVLTSYYLQHISGSQLRNRVYNGMVRSVADNLDYAIIYHRCYPQECFESDQCRVSFRASSIGNFALVQPLR